MTCRAAGPSAALAALQPALADLDLAGIPLRFVTMYVDPAAANLELSQRRAEIVTNELVREGLLTADDVPAAPSYGLEVADQPVLAAEQVRYQGEPVAIVARAPPAAPAPPRRRAAR